jgi:hypothetical protein
MRIDRLACRLHIPHTRKRYKRAREDPCTQLYIGVPDDPSVGSYSLLRNFDFVAMESDTTHLFFAETVQRKA